MIRPLSIKVILLCPDMNDCSNHVLLLYQVIRCTIFTCWILKPQRKIISRRLLKHVYKKIIFWVFYFIISLGILCFLCVYEITTNFWVKIPSFFSANMNKLKHIIYLFLLHCIKTLFFSSNRKKSSLPSVINHAFHSKFSNIVKRMYTAKNK